MTILIITQSHPAMPNLKNIQMGKWHLKNNPLLSHRKRVVKRYPNNRWAFRSQDSKAQASGRSRTSISAPFNDRLLFAFRLTRRDKYVKNYFCKFRINQSKFTYGEKKKKRPNFYGMFSQSLPMSAAFTAILKMKLPQCNAIGVRTPPAFEVQLWCCNEDAVEV